MVVGLDVLVLAVAVALAWFLRGLVPFVPPATAGGIELALMLSPLLIGLWVGLIAGYGGYQRRDLGVGTSEFHRVAKATVVAGFAASTLLYFGDVPLSRGFLVCTFVIGAPALLVERLLVRTRIKRHRMSGNLLHRVLAVGPQSAVRDLAETLRRDKRLGYDLVACTVTDSDQGVDLPVPVAGHVGGIGATCQTFGVDTVMITGSTDLALREVAWDLEGRDVDLIVVPNLAEIAAYRLMMRPLAGLSFLHVEAPQAHRAAGKLKRAFDLAAGVAVLVALAPLMLVVAACIKLSDGGPVFYRQTRVGRHGDTFDMWKFRSMSVNAESIEAELRAEAGHEGALFKLEHDPRVTRVGRFIRRYSIDEVPQLFNVLNGTMSLVGPRPQQQWEVDTYTEIARRRLHVRPGLTGLWQVSGRSRLTWDEALRLDLYYCDNWSLLSDLTIIGKTVKAVVGKDGAY